MDDDFENESDTFVNYSFEVSFCRLIGLQILPSRLTLKLGIEIVTDDDDEIQFALTKINHWLDNVASRAVVVSSSNNEGLQMMLDENNKPMLENPLMVTPMDPTDHHLMFIFQAKLMALADDALAICTVEITSSDSSGLSFTYIGTGEGQLPDMEEWIPGPNWFTVPWWHRNDISMIDTIAPDDADLSVRPVWARTLDHLREDYMEQSAIVIKGDWVPSIIEGDDEK
jgi:hypothetical protein